MCVEYENLPAFCSTCSSIGHLRSSYGWNKSSKVPLTSSAKSTQEKTGDSRVFGDDGFPTVQPYSSKSIYSPVIAAQDKVPLSNVFSAIHQDLGGQDSLVVYTSVGFNLISGSIQSTGFNDGVTNSALVYSSSVADPSISFVSSAVWVVHYLKTIVQGSSAVNQASEMEEGELANANVAQRALRVERRLASLKSSASFPDAQIVHCNDHQLIVLLSIGSQLSNFEVSSHKPFRFQSMWLEHPDYIAIIYRIWSSHVVGRPPQVVINKLRSLNKALKTWNWEVFGDLNSAIAEKSAELHSIQPDLSKQGSDVVIVVQEFFITGVIFPSLNSSFIVLLPKLRDWISIDRFRPIELSNFLFKISSKILADRLARRARIISPQQFRFIRDRHIKDCIALASGYVNVLQKKYCGDGILRSSRLLVPLNVPEGYFCCSRGVRQGDPLSTFLFGIAEDFLSRLLTRMIFCRGTQKNLKNIMGAFRDYDKILSKFAKWKGKSISLAGRATLIRSVITGTFMHSFMTYKWPSSLLSLINPNPVRERVSDFIDKGRWVLDDCFRARFPDLCFQIDRIGISPVVDSLIWANSQDGRASCKATYSQFFHDIPQDVWWRDTNFLEIGCIRNCMDNLLILRRFGFRGRPSKALVIKSVVWSPPASGWIKVNIDGATIGSLRVSGCGGIFRNYRDFVKGCFAIPLG
ncbi:hypothetical protein Dsin_002228 [Dipteronia sinensis]|uniref:Reverse transcriptase domain-containing protein n=1 Tax=Dipteronia sinensis TaxID=43782 RepID=A0AAE0EJS2_9ROSI|nr:hypothetical protein Dsin_002228 [Dipteronia sinensis]